MSSVEFVVECIKERLDAIEVPVSGVETKVFAVLASLLNERSSDYYGRRVATLCPGVPPNSLCKPNAIKVFDAFHYCWKQLPSIVQRPDLRESFENYIACKASYGPSLRLYVNTHLEVTQSLMCLCRYRDSRRTVDLIMKLLAVTYWLFSYYCKKEVNKQHKKTYNINLHRFLSDFIVTFLLLMCVRVILPRFPQPAIPILPRNFKQTIIHLGISPGHAVFQKLVLKEMLKILDIYRQQQTPQQLAYSIHCHCLRNRLLWSKKGADGILRIVKDQSRYMALRSPDLVKNFVADKTRRWISQVVKQITKHNIRDLLKKGDEQGVLTTFWKITTGVDISDDGMHLPPLPEKPPSKLLINLVHHLILYDVCKEFLGAQCPCIDHNAWFVLDSTGADSTNVFISFVRKVARRVVETAVAIPEQWRTESMYPKVAKIAVSLQRLIAARWYVNEVEGEDNLKIAGTAALKQHQEVVFLFVAFRAVLMYLLPQCPCGVQRVASTLPNYAERLRFNLHLRVLD